jgi:hypothetical protein
MRTPTPTDITVEPELAILRILDVAADMALAMLIVFHPILHDPKSHHDRDHYLANRIIDDAQRLRRALADYQHHIDFNLPDDSGFPF